MKKIEILFDKYNFDYISINPKDIDNLCFENNPDGFLMDVHYPKNYLGIIKIKNNDIIVFYNKKMKIGDINFGYNNIKNERKFKINKLFKNEN